MGVRTPTIIMATYVIAACLGSGGRCYDGSHLLRKIFHGHDIWQQGDDRCSHGRLRKSPGAYACSVLLGIVESLCSLYISTAYKDVFSFVILVIVLFCRPQGILGKKSITKV